MKRCNTGTMLIAICTGVLFLSLATIAPLHAQQSKSKKQPKQQQQQTKTKQAKPAKPAAQPKQAAKPSQLGKHVEQGEQPALWQQHRARNWKTEHRTWQQRGGYNGYRIPPAQFGGHFGRGHGFRIYNQTLVIYEGYPSFQYNGFWFGIVDPWPEFWTNDWYQNDDVYIDYSGDGYYLYDLRQPGIGIAINVYID